MPKMTLTLNLSGEADLVYKFEYQIAALLELGKNLGLVKYDMMAIHGDQVITKHGDPDDDIREVVTAEPERPGRGSRMAVRLTDEERAQIIKLKVDENLSWQQISEKMTVSAQAVYRVLKQAGLTKPAPPKMSDEDCRRIDELAKSGVPVADIARQIGRNWSTVDKYLKKKKFDEPKLRLVK